MLEYVNCNLCGKNDTTQLYQMGKVGIVQCNHCALVYTNPRLTEDERLKLYDAKYFTGERDGGLEGGLYDYQSAIPVAYTILETQVKEVLKYKSPPGKLLEIGCATGFFLDIARKRGWETYGVEISDFAGRYAREKLGLKVFIGQLAEAPFNPGSFDVICLYHVLEHVPNPKEYCQRLYQLLKPNGLLVIALPDISSPRARRLKDKWEALQPYVHLFHFSRDSLSNLLSQTGYKIISIYLQGATGFMGQPRTPSKIRKILRKVIVKYFYYFQWLRMVIHFIKVEVFKNHGVITFYARKGDASLSS